MKVTPIELDIAHRFLFQVMSHIEKGPFLPSFSWLVSGNMFSSTVEKITVIKRLDAIILEFHRLGGGNRYVTFFMGDFPTFHVCKSGELPEENILLDIAYEPQPGVFEHVVAVGEGKSTRFSDEKSNAMFGTIAALHQDFYIGSDGFKTMLSDSDTPIMDNVSEFAPFFTKEYYGVLKDHLGIDDTTTPGQLFGDGGITEQEFYSRILTVIDWYTYKKESLIKEWKIPEIQTTFSPQAG